MEKHRDNIYLIGFMGCGKSTVSKVLGKRLGRAVIEMDEEIERLEGMEVKEIFSSKGEEYFRKLETRFLENQSPDMGKIISCGGGVVISRNNRELMHVSGCICLLTASPETILARVAGDCNRPLLEGRRSAEAIKELMEKRREVYEMAADFSVNTDGRTVEEIAQEIIDRLDYEEI